MRDSDHLVFGSKQINCAQLVVCHTLTLVCFPRPKLCGYAPRGRVLVIGGTGQVGGALIEAFGARNCVGTYAATPAEGMIHFDLAQAALAEGGGEKGEGGGARRRGRPRSGRNGPRPDPPRLAEVCRGVLTPRCVCARRRRCSRSWRSIWCRLSTRRWSDASETPPREFRDTCLVPPRQLLPPRRRYLCITAALRPKVVCICAGFTWVDGCEREPQKANAMNNRGPAVLAAAAAAVGAKVQSCRCSQQISDHFLGMSRLPPPSGRLVLH